MKQRDEKNLSTSVELEQPCSSSTEESDLVFSREIGTRLVALRESKTQREVAKELGIHKNTLIRYEKGVRPPDADTLVKICNYYRVSADQVLFGDDGDGWRANHAIAKPKGSHAASNFNENAMVVVIESVEKALAHVGKNLPSDRKAKLTVTIYKLYADADAEPDPQRILSMVEALSDLGD